jgi:hypothetical protein
MYIIWSSAEETAICSNAARKTGCVGQIETWYASLKRGAKIWLKHYILQGAEKHVRYGRFKGFSSVILTIRDFGLSRRPYN